MKIFYIFVFFLFLSCQTADRSSSQKSSFTPGVARSLLVKGQTTKEEVVKIWGSPNIVTQNVEGQSIWTYSKQSYDAKSSQGFGHLFLIGKSSAVQKTAVSSFDVVITFDKKDVVQDFNITSTQF